MHVWRRFHRGSGAGRDDGVRMARFLAPSKVSATSLGCGGGACQAAVTGSLCRRRALSANTLLLPANRAQVYTERVRHRETERCHVVTCPVWRAAISRKRLKLPMLGMRALARARS